MKIPPDYKITPEILDLISKINANLIFLSSLKISSKLKQKIQRANLLKSSLFSARIEGNPLGLEDLNEKSSPDIKKKEIFNIIKAGKYIEKIVKKDSQIDKGLILNIHSLVMFGETGKTKSCRKEIGAIFNQAGIAIYLSPPPTQINQLINQLTHYIKSNKEKFPLITAFISHLVFEKIHPFIDGNGRVGRLLILAILSAKGHKHYFSIPYEEYLDSHRSDYYHFLDIGLKNTNDYLIFMLEAFLEETEKLKEAIERQKESKILLLPPRQEEIYLIIKDHKIVSFDNIHRRFLKVPGRTLRYDLRKLVKKGLIVKIGETRGSYYKIKI